MPSIDEDIKLLPSSSPNYFKSDSYLVPHSASPSWRRPTCGTHNFKSVELRGPRNLQETHQQVTNFLHLDRLTKTETLMNS